MALIGQIVEDTIASEPVDFGLLSSAASVVRDDTAHWINGFDFEDDVCGAEVTLKSICNASVSVSAVEAVEGPRYRSYHPFAIETTYRCSTMGRRPDEIKQRAVDHLEACTQKAAEYEFWTGSLAREVADEDWDDDDGNNPYPNRYLASDDAVDVTPTSGTGVRAKHGIALLERELSRCGCGVKGTIHVPREVASVLGYKGEDGLLKTPLGTPIIAGAGYTGSGPGNATPDAGEAWVYATGPVSVRLGRVDAIPGKINQAVNIATNEIEYFVERPAAVTWKGCCHFAVLVDLSLDYS